MGNMVDTVKSIDLEKHPVKMAIGAFCVFMLAAYGWGQRAGGDAERSIALQTEVTEIKESIVILSSDSAEMKTDIAVILERVSAIKKNDQ